MDPTCRLFTRFTKWSDLFSVPAFLHVWPEHVDEEDGDGQQEDDCIEEKSDDHSRCTWLVNSEEVPVKLGCVSHRCVWAVGETLRRQGMKEKKEQNRHIWITVIQPDICNMVKLLPGTKMHQKDHMMAQGPNTGQLVLLSLYIEYNPKCNKMYSLAISTNKKELL